MDTCQAAANTTKISFHSNPLNSSKASLRPYLRLLTIMCSSSSETQGFGDFFVKWAEECDLAQLPEEAVGQVVKYWRRRVGGDPRMER